MSRVACQGLQSCFESQLVETKTLRLKLASPNPYSFESIGSAHYEEINHNNMSSNPELGGWNFLQSLSNSSQSPNEELDKESSYSYPMCTKSSSILSEKSLEMCTENLGSETGTDITESSIFSLPSPDFEGGETPAREPPKPRQLMEYRKVKNSRNFPPPLTTMSCSSSIQVRPHREGGRLIIEAFESPSAHTNLQAERSHGRLRLCFWKDCSNSTAFDSEMDTEENEDSDSEELENEASDEEKEEEDEFEEEQDEEESDFFYVREDMEGNSLDIRGEMGMEKFRRPSRCKEGGCGNKGLCNWESFWVATS